MSATALDSSVTLDEVFTVVATKRVPLAPELAGYLALELAEHADPSGGDVDPKSVYVGEEGTVALVKPRREEPCGSAEASIRAALARLLDASGSQTPALAAASKRKSGSGLGALADELEAALIPVNRAAARRALARLAREVKRVTLGVGRAALPSTSDAAPSSRRASSPGTPAPPRALGPAPLVPPSPPRAADGEDQSAQPERGERAVGTGEPFGSDEEPTTTRKAVPEEVMRKATPQPPSVDRRPVGPIPASTGEDEPPSTVQFRPSEPSPSQTDIDSLIANFGVSGGAAPATSELKAIAGLEPTPPPPPPATLPKTPRERATRARAPGRSDEAFFDPRLLPTEPSKLRQRASLPSAPRRKSGGSRFVLALGLVAVAAGTFAVWRLRPSAAVEPAPEPSLPSARALVSAPAACRGTLVVTDVPARAEVLLREGQAPVDVEHMPMGARLEFVATAEGFAPKRVVVPADATWDATPEGKPRLELAVQLDKSHGRPGTSNPWPASEPGSTVGGKGAPGTVHVVATPRGAEVWLLAGMGPETRVEQVSCNEDVDVLLAGPGPFRKRLHVTPSDFVAGEAPPSPGVARVSAR